MTLSGVLVRWHCPRCGKHGKIDPTVTTVDQAHREASPDCAYAGEDAIAGTVEGEAMTNDDEQCLRLGREIVRMIRDLQKTSRGETGYARRKFTFPGGEAHVILANDKRVADVMDQAAAKAFEIAEALPPSLQQ